jgi:probable F420-dependent oxidoreductase
MRFGVTIFATDQTVNPVEVAVAAEARGFDSLYLPEHTHIPVERRTPPPVGGGELPTEYKRTVDPLIVLAACTAVTTTMRLGTGVALPAQREPIVTAKAIATLQNLSDGRFCFGVGFGWNEDEMEDHGVAYSTRRAQSREHVLAMQSLWTEEVAGFDGDFVHISPSWSWPKPEPRIPVLIGGGAGPKMFAHIAEYADGWIPIGGAGLTEAIPHFKEAMARSGRDPDAMEIVPFGSLPSHDKLDHFERIGVTECVFRLPSAGRDEVMAVLDQYGELVAARR